MSDLVVTPEEYISRAKAGDAEAGRFLILWFVLEAKTGSPELDHYVSDALLAILGGADPREALNIKRPRHRPADREKADRDFHIAVAVRDLRRSGMKREEAIAEVCESFHVSESTVQRAWDLLRPILERSTAAGRKVPS